MRDAKELLTLEEAAAQPVYRVGGKARTLGCLRQRGFPVPTGYVIPIGSALPAALEQLTAALASHSDMRWAVRSSAASEDSGQASYAGQFSSYLNLPIAEVPDAVIRCRDASTSPRLDAYRFLTPAETEENSRPAVIVQAMAPSEVAGIAFTADPRTGLTNELWIEMVTGSGSQAADGTVRSELVRLDRLDLTRISSDSHALLEPNNLQELGKLCLTVESALGEAQDIEWAYGEGKFALLQARPLTTIHKNWTRANVAEIFPEPVTPLTWSILQGFLAGRREGTTSLTRLFGGKVHLRRDLVLRSFEWLLVIDPPTVERALGAEVGGKIGWQRFARPDYWAATLLFLGDYAGISQRLQRRVTRFLAAPRPTLGNEPRSFMDCTSLIDAWQDWTAGAFRLHLYATTYAIAASRLAQSEMGEGSIRTRSARIGFQLRGLAQQARDLGLEEYLKGEGSIANLIHTAQGAQWLASFNAFLGEFGDRCTNEFELISPRWNEKPEIPLGIIRGFLTGQKNLGNRADTKDDLASTKPYSEFRILPGSRNANGFEILSAVREEMKHAVACGYSAMRQVYLQAGELLCSVGKLQDPQDIFFLTDREVRQISYDSANYFDRITLRRNRWEGWRGQEVITSTQTEATGSERLSGIAVSRGIVHGAARVVRTLTSTLTMQPGEVLVLPNADPAWTPLFLQSAAVVCDAGGLLSHSATVAREFGIPAIFNVGEATCKIRDGQLITVNADEGWVEI